MGYPRSSGLLEVRERRYSQRPDGHRTPARQRLRGRRDRGFARSRLTKRSRRSASPATSLTSGCATPSGQGSSCLVWSAMGLLTTHRKARETGIGYAKRSSNDSAGAFTGSGRSTGIAITSERPTACCLHSKERWLWRSNTAPRAALEPHGVAGAGVGIADQQSGKAGGR